MAGRGPREGVAILSVTAYKYLQVSRQGWAGARCQGTRCSWHARAGISHPAASSLGLAPQPGAVLPTQAAPRPQGPPSSPPQPCRTPHPHPAAVPGGAARSPPRWAR